jgi:hypothetical protein
VATAYLEAEKHFRRIMGYKSLWMLEAALRDEKEVTKEGNQRPEVAVTEEDPSEAGTCPTQGSMTRAGASKRWGRVFGCCQI